MRFRSDVAGYVKGVRFYKGSLNTGTHVGSVWTDTGTLLAQGTFTGESASGWQALTFATPVAITANTTYVASYHTDAGFYSSNNDFFATAGVDAPPLHALKDTASGSNGIYLYGGGGFPLASFRSTNYWVDVVFDVTFGDSTPPSLTVRAPAPGSTGAAAGTKPVATFSESVQPATIVMGMSGPVGAVPGSTAYDAATRSATFTPADPLAFSTTYTVAVSGAKDAAGNTMAPDSWSFTTGPPPPPPTDAGPGGPILLVTSGSDRPVSAFYTEILRTEGLNEFKVIDISQLSAAQLATADIVLLAEVSLSSSQVAALTDFVNAGGNVIAMRPDPKLAGLLGLTSTSGTRSEGYLAVDPAVPAAAGITPDTLQYHGTADGYALNGATTVARLYSSSTTATADPAVSLRTVGANGGEAAAFTYDLARSVIATRQGNQAWVSQSRDGLSPIRSHELYYGGSLTDWVDLAKVAIPQADEQQRLLANLVQVMARNRKPLPRFWYFPRSLKAVVVGTGDDHAGGGTAGRFDQYLAASPVGCSVPNWTCPRFTSYIYRNTPLSNARALNYVNRGFEVALHPNNGCQDFTPASLEQTFATQIAGWQSKYSSLPAPVTNRTHCLVWSDWATEPKTELAHAMRYDANYYYWPSTWIADRPGVMNGSGMPMRFADASGAMLNVYQGLTSMTDESGQSYPATINALLDNALGTKGYYGAFTTNLHTDGADTFENDEVMAAAQARNVPIVSAKQMLTWLDARNGSSFKNLAYSAGTLTFSVSAATGATGLTAMVPTAAADGALLSSLTLNGAAVSYQTQTVKGLEYASFQTAAGTYTARYTQSAAPAVGQMAAMTTDQGATAVVWKTSRPATSEVAWGQQQDTLDHTVKVAEDTRDHELDLPRFDPGEVYWFRVTSRDASGRTVSFPAADKPPYAYKIPDWLGHGPAITGVRAVAMPDGTATVNWATDRRSDASLALGTAPDALVRQAGGGDFGLVHTVPLDGLEAGRRYYYRVSSSTPWGVRAVSPVLSFDAPGYGVADSRLAEWQTGSLTDGVSLGTVGDGELRLSGSGGKGTFTSRLLDAEQMVTWRQVIWDATVSAGAVLRVQVRTGSIAPADESWTAWTDVPQSGAAPAVQASRYLQYRVRVSGSDSAAAVVRAIGASSSGRAFADPTEGGG